MAWFDEYALGWEREKVLNNSNIKWKVETKAKNDLIDIVSWPTYNDLVIDQETLEERKREAEIANKELDDMNVFRWFNPSDYCH